MNAEQKIAIVGAACYYPDAPNLAAFHQNILRGRVHTRAFPIESRWGDCYRPNSEPSPHYTYCNQGGSIDYDIYFDPVEYSMPPNELMELDPDQLMSINLTRAALADAGISVQLKNLEAISCGVVLGKVSHVGPASARVFDLFRVLPQVKSLLREVIPDITEATLKTFEERFLKQRNDFYGTKGVSVMSNLLASRVAERLNLQGPSYIVDGACASSLIALQQAMRELRLGNAEMMAAGGVMFPMMSGFWKGFSYLGGLSRKGSISAFDQRADGIVLGEGGGVVILTTLDRALKDGHRIYAVIDAIECNNDGRGTGILAPSQSGQERVLSYTWSKTPITPDQLSYVECHGTGMPLGDKTELASMQAVFGSYWSSANRLAIGSVKSQIGHTLAAAGIAAVIKSALCLYHRIIPPTSNCEQPAESLRSTVFRTVSQVEPLSDDKPIHMAVNAFGFGGVNSHAILTSMHHAPSSLVNGTDHRHGDHGASVRWSSSAAPPTDKPPELVIAAHSPQALLDSLDSPISQTSSLLQTAGKYRLIIKQAHEPSLEHARKVIAAGKRSQGTHGVFYSPHGRLQPESKGKLALVFPGISYYEPDYANLISRYQIDINEFVNRANAASDGMRTRGSNGMILSYVLSHTFKMKGIHVDGVAGFSLGELSSFIATGVLGGKEITHFLDAFEEQNDADSIVNHDYMMLAVSNANREKVSQVIAGMPDTYIALINSDRNLILSTHKKNQTEITQRFRQEKILFFDIGVNAVSHTPLNKPVMDAILPLLQNLPVKHPDVEVWSSVSGAKCPHDEQAIRDLMYRNLFTQVDFASLVRNMYADGYRVFIQCGMGGVSGYIKETLSGSDVLTLDAVNKSEDLETSLQNIVYQLWSEGYSAPGASPAASAGRFNSDSETPTRSRVAVKLTDMASENFSTSALVEGTALVCPVAARGQSPSLSPAVTTLGTLYPQLDEAFKTMLVHGQQTFHRAQTDVLDAFLQAGEHPVHFASQRHVALEHSVAAVVVPTVTDRREEAQAQAGDNHSGGARHAADADDADDAKFVHHTQTERFDFERFPEFRHHEILKHPPELRDEFRSGVAPLSSMIFRACEVVNNLFPTKKIRCLTRMHAKKFIGLNAPTTVETAYTQIADNKVDVVWHEHFSCLIELTDAIQPQPYDASKWKITHPSTAAPRSYYQDGMLFHGPSFHGLEHLVGSTDKNELMAYVNSPGGYSAQLDSCFQISACWYSEFSGDAASLILPMSIERIEFACDSRDFIAQHYPAGHCVIFNTRLDEMFFTWDADYYHDSQLILNIRGFKDFKFESSAALQGLYEAPHKLDNSVSKCIHPDVYLYEADVATTWSWDMLRSCYLSNQERERLDTIKLFPERTAFVCGRIAAKDAFRMSRGLDMHMATLNVANTKLGAPYYDIAPAAEQPSPPTLSIAHKKRIGVAAIGRSEMQVGIDVEEIATAEKLESALVFSDQEQAQLAQSDNPAMLKAILWTAKEAYLKTNASRYANYASQLAKVEVTEVKSVSLADSHGSIKQAFQGVVNGTTIFTAVQWRDDYMITWIKETPA